MARPLRIQFPGAVYHIISRGIEGRDIFRSDSEKQKFLKLVLKAKQFYRIDIRNPAWKCKSGYPLD